MSHSETQSSLLTQSKTFQITLPSLGQIYWCKIYEHILVVMCNVLTNIIGRNDSPSYDSFDKWCHEDVKMKSEDDGMFFLLTPWKEVRSPN